jgi:hypothetical protein
MCLCPVWFLVLIFETCYNLVYPIGSLLLFLLGPLSPLFLFVMYGLRSWLGVPFMCFATSWTVYSECGCSWNSFMISIQLSSNLPYAKGLTSRLIHHVRFLADCQHLCFSYAHREISDQVGYIFAMQPMLWRTKMVVMIQLGEKLFFMGQLYRIAVKIIVYFEIKQQSLSKN